MADNDNQQDSAPESPEETTDETPAETPETPSMPPLPSQRPGPASEIPHAGDMESFVAQSTADEDIDESVADIQPVDAKMEDEPLDDTESDSMRQQRTKNANIPAIPLDEQTADLLLRMYLSRRLDYQIEFYQSRIREYDDNSDLMFRLGALVMSLSSLFAALSLQGDDAFLRLMTAILPAFAALLASFQQLYQWERQAGIYRDTVLGLSEAQLVIPDKDMWKRTTAIELYGDLVKRAETVFKEEVSQWGQVAIGNAEEESKQEAVRTFAEDYGLDIFNPDGTIDEEKIGMLQGILEAGVSTPDSQINIDFPALTGGAQSAADDIVIETEDPDNPNSPSA